MTRVVKLSDVCRLIKGKKPTRFVNDGIPYLTAKSIRKSEDPKFVSPDDKSCVQVSEKDLVIIMDGSNSGEIFTGLDGALASTMGIIWHDTSLDTGYLLHFLRLHRENFANSKTGSAIPHLNKERFESLEIPLSSTEEQSKIVEKLDKAFVKIDRTIELTQKNLQNSQDLFEAELRDKLSYAGAINNKLGSVMTLQRGFDLPRSQRTEGSFALVSSSGVIDSHNEYKAAGPGVYTGRSGSVGSTFYQETDFWPLNTTLYVKDFHGNNPRYCYWLLKSIDLKKYAGGTGVPTLNRNHVHEVDVYIAPPEQQADITKEIDKAEISANKLKDLYTQKLNKLEELKQSMLEEAFRGRVEV